MASIKLVNAPYSSKLDPMAHVIGNYLRSAPNSINTNRTWKAVYDFCHNNTSQFFQEFVQRIGEPMVKPNEQLGTNSSELFEGFVNRLASLSGECIFLLKDTHAVMRAYQEKTGKGYGVLINRAFLCDDDEERYFTLIQLFYSALEEAQEWDQFLEAYLLRFRHLTQNDAHFRDKANQIYDYFSVRDFNDPIIWVDLGFQFTFVLFCYASMHVRSYGTIAQKLFCLTVYPWLNDIFQGNFFTDNNESVLDMELDGIHSFFQDRMNRLEGSLLGFAIGDALGFPIAGINKKDLSRFVHIPIHGFTDNHQHPYFSALQPGQFTDNTSLLLLSVEHLMGYGSFQVDDYVSKLIDWGKPLLEGTQKQRWLGPTTTGALRRLIAGTSYRYAGSKETESCSATYRVIPFALVYSPFGASSQEKLVSIVKTVTMITHNSRISEAGAFIVALLISNLLSGIKPERALRAAIKAVQWDFESRPLESRLMEAIRLHQNHSGDAYAREILGTGSPIYQTLPLACFCFLKHSDDFTAAITAAANAYREDNAEEIIRLSGLSWEEELLVCKGGNTDGIAALTGAFVGAYLGYKAIPDDFLKVECGSVITQLANDLAFIMPAQPLASCR